jgi:acyltransferase-like protein
MGGNIDILGELLAVRIVQACRRRVGHQHAKQAGVYPSAPRRRERQPGFIALGTKSAGSRLVPGNPQFSLWRQMTSSVNVPLRNLRAVVILIVVGFHTALPYLASQPAQPFAFDAAPYRWIAFPIIDHERWFGFDLFCAWQDVSLMTLMFFLAGLFAPASLGRKGPLAYLSDRWWRIGLPFVLGATILSPLAYYAAYRLTATDPSLGAFWQHWRALPLWPSGPQWFLWQLFLLSALAAALHGFVPQWGHALSQMVGQLNDRALTFFVMVTALSCLAYLPLALAFTPWDWTYLGPFSFQLSRPLHYVVYFLTGFAVGSYGCDRSVLRADGPVARHWLAWLVAAVICFGAWGGLTSLTLPDWNESSLSYRFAAAMAFPFACAAGVLAYLAMALRLLRRPERILGSLSVNAYGIYLVHYVFVLWLQYALVGVPLNALVKVTVVFSAALALSWAASAAGRTVVTACAKALMRRPTAIAQRDAIADHTQ